MISKILRRKRFFQLSNQSSQIFHWCVDTCKLFFPAKICRIMLWHDYCISSCCYKPIWFV